MKDFQVHNNLEERQCDSIPWSQRLLNFQFLSLIKKKATKEEKQQKSLQFLLQITHNI